MQRANWAALLHESSDPGRDYGVDIGPDVFRQALQVSQLHASLYRKIEMLPWDEWGPMTDSYDNKTGDDFDVLIDDLAVATIDEDDGEMHRIYETLTVPVDMVQ